MIFQTIFDYIISIFITIGTIFNLIPGLIKGIDSYSPEKDNIALNCVVVSDTHFDKNTFRDRTNIMRKTFAGISECTEDIDVLLNAGDITNSGCEGEYRNCRRITNTYAQPGHVVACLGNHDSWHESASPNNELARELFIKYVNKNGINCSTVYYSTQINGYWFICLASETLDMDDYPPLYSDEQLSWFDSELTKAEKSNLPIFILTHRPLGGHNGISNDYIPKEADLILQNHSEYGKPIFVFSGHYHRLSPDWFEQCGNICYFQLPSTEYNDETEYECNDQGGMGLTMEVYDNEIIVKARNFQKDIFLEGYKAVVSF